MAKFRFWSTSTSARGSERGGSVQAGNSVHTRGWDAGVKVTPHDSGGCDGFHVWLTHGSHAAGRDVHLGTVRDTPAGPVWVPAELPAGVAIPAGPAPDETVFGTA